MREQTLARIDLLHERNGVLLEYRHLIVLGQVVLAGGRQLIGGLHQKAGHVIGRVVVARCRVDAAQ